MDTNITSSGIHVFPLAKNRPTDRRARLFYEDNVANIVRQVVDVNGFITSPSIDSTGLLRCEVKNSENDIELVLNKMLSFNLNGYYFEIASDTALYTIVRSEVPEKGTKSFKLYASIKLDKDKREISGQDEGAVYTGLVIKEALSDDYIQLPLFNCALYVDSNGNRVTESSLIKSSYKRFESSSLDYSIDIIDGKREVKDL